MNALAKKLLLKPGKHWLLFNAPDNYLQLLQPLPEATTIAFEAAGSFDGVQLFVKNSAELAASMTIINPLLKAESILWIIYPKKSSGIKSDLELMRSWDELTKYGWNGVAAAAIDATWTALRFRPTGQSKPSATCNDDIRKNEYGEYIDVDNKQIKLPPDIYAALTAEPAALNGYQQLSYSNKKEYVLWILTAKQEKTRIERLAKMLEKILAGKKNPSEK